MFITSISLVVNFTYIRFIRFIRFVMFIRLVESIRNVGGVRDTLKTFFLLNLFSMGLIMISTTQPKEGETFKRNPSTTTRIG